MLELRPLRYATVEQLRALIDSNPAHYRGMNLNDLYFDWLQHAPKETTMSNELNPGLPEHDTPLDNMCRSMVDVDQPWPPQVTSVWIKADDHVLISITGVELQPDGSYVIDYQDLHAAVTSRMTMLTTKDRWYGQWTRFGTYWAGLAKPSGLPQVGDDHSIMVNLGPPQRAWPPRVDSIWTDADPDVGAQLRSLVQVVAVNVDVDQDKGDDTRVIEVRNLYWPQQATRNFTFNAKDWHDEYVLIGTYWAGLANPLAAGLNGTTASDLPSENKVGYEPQGMSYSEIAERNAQRVLKVSTLLSTYERAVVTCATQPDPFRVYAERCDRARQAVLDACAE